jgi:hypothetical protein
MSTFVKGGGVGPTFGRNEFLRSTNPKPQTETYMCAAASVPAFTYSQSPIPQKILQPGMAMAKITSGPDAGKTGPRQAGVTDGRQDVANLVGLDLTFLPWQLLERDVEISVVTNGTCVQAWCFELDAAGNPIVLTNAAADAMRGGKRLDINFS